MSLSLTGLLNAVADNTSEHYVLLVALTHANFSPLRFCSDAENIFTHQGNVYTPLAMDITLPTVEDGGARGGELVLDSVGEEPVASLRAADSPITVTVSIALESDPNTVQFGPHVVKGTPSATYDGAEFRMRIGHTNVFEESYPQRVFSVRDWKGMG